TDRLSAVTASAGMDRADLEPATHALVHRPGCDTDEHLYRGGSVDCRTRHRLLSNGPVAEGFHPRTFPLTPGRFPYCRGAGCRSRLVRLPHRRRRAERPAFVEAPRSSPGTNTARPGRK